MRAQLSLALLLATTTVACVDEPTATPDEVVSALERENGGLDTTDEAPLFGAEAQFAAAAIEPDTAVVDPMASDPAVVEMRNLATARILDVIVMWGHLRVDPDAPTARDWSGTLGVNRGALAVRRTIAFEDVQDRLLPRDNRLELGFVSRTRPAADGLALTIIDPEPGTPLILGYAGNDSTAVQFDLSTLADGPVVHDFGDGNHLVIVANRRDDSCAHGTLRGRWHKVAPNASVYLGVVSNADGEVVGHVRGIAGQRRSGEPVMFGKYIGTDGTFGGIFAGTYREGEFAGRWIDRDGDRGTLRGHYFEGMRERSGGFIGRWAERTCQQAPAAP